MISIKNKIIGLFIVSLFVFIGLTSCSLIKNKNDNYLISVNTFGFENNLSKTTEDNIDLKVVLENYNDFTICGLKINNTNYELDTDDDENESFSINVALVGGVNTFTLSSVVYMVEKEGNEALTLDFPYDETISITKVEENDTEESIKIVSIEPIKTVANQVDENNYVNTYIQLKVVLENPNNYKINSITINGEELLVGLNNFEDSDEVVYYSPSRFKLTGDAKFYVNGVSYTDNSDESNPNKIVKLNFTNENANIDVTTRSIVPLSFEISGTPAAGTVLCKTSEGNVATEINSSVSLEVKVENKDYLIPGKAKVLVDGTEVNLEPDFTDPLTDRVHLVVYTIALSNSGEHEIQLKGLIGYNLVDGVEQLTEFKDEKTLIIDTYDKIIKTNEDFYKIKNEGNYLLANDLVLSKKIEIPNFSGTLNGNGHELNMNFYTFSTPLFGVIEEGAVVKNLKYTSFTYINSSSYSKIKGVLTEENHGIIKNVYINPLKIINRTTSSLTTETTGIVEDNYGEIYDLLFETGTSGIVSNGTINGIFKNNYGTIARVVNQVPNYGGYSKTNGLKEINFLGHTNQISSTLISSYTYFNSVDVKEMVTQKADLNKEYVNDATYNANILSGSDAASIVFNLGCKEYFGEKEFNLYFTEDSLYSSAIISTRSTKTGPVDRIDINFKINKNEITFCGYDEVNGKNTNSFRSGSLGFNTDETLWTMVGLITLIMAHTYSF